MIKLSIILRLAIVLSRSRNAIKLPTIKLEKEDNSINIDFNDGWLSENPLTEADLETEANYLSNAGYNLKYKVSTSD